MKPSQLFDSVHPKLNLYTLAVRDRGKEAVMPSSKTRSFNPPRFPGMGGVLVLVLCLATAMASQAQTFTTLGSFDGADGANPQAGLAQGRDGNFYGTTTQGGNEGCSEGCGTVFKITLAGKLARLHQFCNLVGCGDGANPQAGLVLAPDGNFYGTSGSGTAAFFKITPLGALTTLYNFCSQPHCTDGSSPISGVVLATDGNFYGTTGYGGANSAACKGNGCGTIFEITPAGALATLYSFCAQANCADGANPLAGVVQATDGNFYGTTAGGGANNSSACDVYWEWTGGCGTVFKITPAGKLTTLYSFCSEASCADGASPLAALVPGTDWNFYGATYGGGGSGAGTVFKITAGGKLTMLYGFCSQAECPDGTKPAAGLVQATDGNFYGTTFGGGANEGGTVFEITPSGALTTLYNFCSQSGCTDGREPYAELLQATNGNFYGTTFGGGAHQGDGTVFSLSMGLGPFVAFVRNFGRVGWKVEILGQGFTGTTAVSFNGTPATFKVWRDTYLTATVPQGATTGCVTVTTPGGLLQSNVKFRVRK